jgi:hypothetical protein
MDSVNKYGSDGVPFTGKVAEIKPTEQQIQQMIDALVPVAQCITDVIVPQIQSIFDSFVKLWDEVLKSYPDKRVVWLAFHHPKERVRKKNRNRIGKHIAKAVKRDD